MPRNPPWILGFVLLPGTGQTEKREVLGVKNRWKRSCRRQTEHRNTGQTRANTGVCVR